MTSPFEFYQFWINAADQDIGKFIRYFTLKTKEEVEAAEAEFANNPNALKQMLAEELTIRVHSKEAYESVQKVTDILFNKKANKDALLALKEADLKIVASLKFKALLFQKRL